MRRIADSASSDGGDLAVAGSVHALADELARRGRAPEPI